MELKKPSRQTETSPAVMAKDLSALVGDNAPKFQIYSRIESMLESESDELDEE